MHHRETKTVFSLEIIENQIKSFEKFNDIQLDLCYPENRKTVIQILNQLLDPKIENAKYFPAIQKIINALHYLETLAKDPNAFLPDVLDAYQQLIADEKIALFVNKMNAAFMDHKISLIAHYKTMFFFRTLVGTEKSLALLISKDTLSEKNKESIHATAMNYFIKKSGLIDYIQTAIDSTLNNDLQGWQAIKKLAQDLVKNSQYKNESECIEVVNHLIQEPLTELAHDFIRIKGADHLEPFISFLNQHYASFPPELKKKLSPKAIEKLLQRYNEAKPDFILQLDTHDHAEDKAEEKQAKSHFYDYREIYNNVSILFHHCFKQDSPPTVGALSSLYDYVLALVNEEDYLRELYKFSLIQNFYSMMYLRAVSKNKIDSGVYFINDRMRGMMSDMTEPDGLLYLARVAMPLLYRLTDSQPTSLSSTWLSRKYRKAEIEMPVFLRDKLASQNPGAQHLIKYVEIDERRIKLLSILSKKEIEYHNAIDKQIIELAKQRGGAVDDLVNILVLRLVAVNYIRDKIYAGDVISSVAIKNEMERLFGKKIFASRNLGECFLIGLIKKLDSLRPIKDMTPALLSSSQAVGLFKDAYLIGKSNLNQKKVQQHFDEINVMMPTVGSK